MSDWPGPSEPAENLDRNGGQKLAQRELLGLHHVFWGHNGLRPLWGVLTFWLLREFLLGLLNPLMAGVLQPAAGPSGTFAPRELFTFEGAAVVAVAIATALMAQIEKRRIDAYGLGIVRGLSRLLTGALWGVTSLSLLIFLLWTSGLLVFDRQLLFGTDALQHGVVWLAGFLLVGLAEELSFRGYLQFTLARGFRNVFERFTSGKVSEPRLHSLAFWTTAVLLSFGFGFGHRTNQGESPLGLVSAGLIGIVFCFSLWRTGSLWWAIGFHATWDWAESFLYGVADSGTMIRGHMFETHPVGRPLLSGGFTGPEGSIWILPIILLLVAIIWTTLPKQHCCLSQKPLD